MKLLSFALFIVGYVLVQDSVCEVAYYKTSISHSRIIFFLEHFAVDYKILINKFLPQ